MFNFKILCLYLFCIKINIFCVVDKNTKNEKFINKKNLLNLAFNNKRYFLTGLVIGGFGSALIFHKKQNFLFRNLSVGIGSCSILSILFLIFKNRKKENNKNKTLESVEIEIPEEASVINEKKESNKINSLNNYNKKPNWESLLSAKECKANQKYQKESIQAFKRCKEILTFSCLEDQISNLKNFIIFCSVAKKNNDFVIEELLLKAKIKEYNDEKNKILQRIIDILDQFEKQLKYRNGIDGDVKIDNMDLWDREIKAILETVCLLIDQYIDIQLKELFCFDY